MRLPLICLLCWLVSSPASATETSPQKSAIAPAEWPPPALEIAAPSPSEVWASEPDPIVPIAAPQPLPEVAPAIAYEAPAQIVLENRETGCVATADALHQVDRQLCAPPAPAWENPEPAHREIRPNLQVRVVTPPAPWTLTNGDRAIVFPLSIPAVISSTFGWRVHPIHQTERFHSGTDLAAPEGTPVVAALSGTVEIASWLSSYGFTVVLSHPNHLETRYAHLSEILVSPGQTVKQGTPIGLVGSTGLSTGPHLHFELWQKLGTEWAALDPGPYLLAALAELQRYLATQTGRSRA
ncbi:MAG: peptidoglycan DD-metalloendopeptidase family protein [Pseudanabaenaceae cyanobacterium]